MDRRTMASLTTCDECGGPANWTMFDGVPWYSCKLRCDGFMQLELLPEDVVQPTYREVGNFPHGSEYAEREGRESGSAASSAPLPWD